MGICKKNFSCLVIQNNFDFPNYRVLGNKDPIDAHGKINFISELNRKFNKYDTQNDWFNVLDINYLSFLKVPRNGRVKEIGINLDIPHL